MIGAAIGNTLSTIVINVLSSCVYEGKQKAVDTVKLNKLKIEIDEWIEDYCRENDGSILTSSAFQNYVCYQNPILKIYNYVSELDIQKPLENIFIGNLISDCKESVVSSGRTFSVGDNSTVSNFFVKVLNKYKEFLSNNLDLSDKYGLYVTGQIIKSESDGIIKEVQKVEDITKKLCDMISQEDISEERKVNIYFSLCDFLWRGYIEEVCSILPLIKSRNQELNIAIKMNLTMISDCRFEKLYSLDVLGDIKCDSIKKDIIRKMILLNIENADLLENLLLVTNDSILRQIIGDIINGDFSNFYTQEVEIQYGAEVKSISKKEYYDTEPWLVERIIFMYLYKQNNYGIYNSMKELIKENKNVLEELFIWEKQELEYIDAYSQDGNTDNLKKLCAELKGNISRYSRIKLEYKKIFYFILIRSAVLTDDTEMDNIIEGLPDAFNEDIDIQEIIFLLQIKKGVAIQQEIVKFCQSTRRYMLLYDFLIQWVNTPEKIILFFEEYKYLLSEHLILFLMYVQMVRITKGTDCSKNICMRYQDNYGNYLEYLLEMFQESKEKSILDTIAMKRKDGSLLYLNNQAEEILVEIFIQNDMYDDAMEIIRKYEILKKMSPRKLRMKAAILLAKENVLEALNTFLDIFEIYRDDPYVINNILSISLQNKRVVPENIMFYAQKSNNVDTLTLVAMVYERESEFELSRKFLTMALLRSGKKNIDAFGKYWGLSISQDDNTIVEIKNADKDTAVFLKERDTECTMIYCIYRDKIGRSYYQSDEFKMKRYKHKNDSFRPISKFGIGILSCFLQGDRLDISTRHYETGHGIRFCMTGLEGYYTVSEEEAGDRGSAMPGSEESKWVYRQNVGTTIAVRLRDSIPKSLEDILLKYVCFPDITVTYKKNETCQHMFTKQELFQFVNRNPQIELPLSEEMIQKTQVDIPLLKWKTTPRIVIGCTNLNQLIHLDNDNISGVDFRVEFGGEHNIYAKRKIMDVNITRDLEIRFEIQRDKIDIIQNGLDVHCLYIEDVYHQCMRFLINCRIMV